MFKSILSQRYIFYRLQFPFKGFHLALTDICHVDTVKEDYLSRQQADDKTSIL